MMATYGKPDRDVRAKIEGAFPTNARPSTRVTGKRRIYETISMYTHKVHENSCTDHLTRPTTLQLAPRR